MSILIGAGIVGIWWHYIRVFVNKNKDIQSNFQVVYVSGQTDQLLDLLRKCGFVNPKTWSANSNDIKNNVDSSAIVFNMSIIDSTEIIRQVRHFSKRFAFYFYDDVLKQILSSGSPSDQGLRIDQKVQYRIHSPVARHQKRVFDCAFSFMIFPLVLFGALATGSIQPINNLILVIKGTKTWVSYMDHIPLSVDLPSIRTGWIDPVFQQGEDTSPMQIEETILQYARHYSVFRDIFVIIFKMNVLLRTLIR